MNFEIFVEFLVDPSKLQPIMEEAKVDLHNGIIYLKDKLAIESQVHLFSEEMTDDLIEFKENDFTYIQLFPLKMAIDLISDFSRAERLSNRQLSERLIHYAIYDA